MNREKGRSFWVDKSDEDINILKFLKLLLKYDYTWYRNNEMKLNLTETDKSRFLKECSESIEYMDEIKASTIIEIIRYQFEEEIFRLQKGRRNADQPILPWFSQAYQVFRQSSTSEASSITSSCPPMVAIASNTPLPSVPALRITNASTSATPIVKPFSWTTLLPNWNLTSLGQEKQLANPSSSREGNYNESPLKKVKPQYNFPITYPVCILPCFSLGRSGEGSGTCCSRNESESLFGKGTPVNLPSSSHQHISDFSYLLGNDRIPNPTISNRPDSSHFQITTQSRYSSQPSSPLNGLEQIVTGFTADSLKKKCEPFTNIHSFRVPFQSPTSKASPVSRGAISSGTKAKFLNPKRGKSKLRTSRSVETRSSTLLPH